MSVTLKITAKGQITLKRDVLAHLGARPGDTVTVELKPGGVVEARAAALANAQRPLADMSGSLNALKRKDPLSIEDINAIIAKGWAGEL